VVVPMGVQAVDFPSFLQSCSSQQHSWSLVTMPHKMIAIELADEVSPTLESRARPTSCASATTEVWSRTCSTVRASSEVFSARAVNLHRRVP